MPATPYIIPLFVAIGSFLVLAAIRHIIFKLAKRVTAKDPTPFASICFSSLRASSWYWAIAIALSIGIAISDIPLRYTRHINMAIDIIIVFSVTIAIANLAGKSFLHYVQTSKLFVLPTGLIHGVIKGIVFIIGCLVVLNMLGISIAPLITALGVGGLAVALALQDTLANLFSGIHILLEKSVRIGDFIKLESGQEGYVEDITWRTTRVRMLPNNTVIVPNHTLAKSIVTNYYLPEKRLSVLVPVSVSYNSDPAVVESILIDVVMKSLGAVPGLLADPAPTVRFLPGFGESSLDFTLICQVEEFVDQYLARHELHKRIFERFKTEGIEIPFPQRTLHIHKA